MGCVGGNEPRCKRTCHGNITKPSLMFSDATHTQTRIQHSRENGRATMRREISTAASSTRCIPNSHLFYMSLLTIRYKLHFWRIDLSSSPLFILSRPRPLLFFHSSSVWLTTSWNLLHYVHRNIFSQTALTRLLHISQRQNFQKLGKIHRILETLFFFVHFIVTKNKVTFSIGNKVKKWFSCIFQTLQFPSLSLRGNV